jgi:Protein of unknown function (DUF2637)
MTGTGQAIRWSMAGAVSVAALVAAFVSYRHALTVVRAHNESGTLALAYPLTIDGLIHAASMMLLNAAQQRTQAHWLAYAALALRIAATLAANVAAGRPYARPEFMAHHPCETNVGTHSMSAAVRLTCACAPRCCAAGPRRSFIRARRWPDSGC